MNKIFMQGTISNYRSIEQFPYNSLDPYGKSDLSSNFVKGFEDAKFAAPGRYNEC